MTTNRSANRAGRIALFVLGGLVVVIGVAWAVLASLFPPAKLRSIVQRQLSGTLARELRFDDARLGLWPPVRLTVAGPALAEPDGFAAGTMFQARELALDLDVVALLSNHLVVRRLVLDRPALHLVLRADGTTNLDGIGAPRAPGAKPAGKPMDLAVRAFVVRDGQALVDDLKTARRVAFGIGTQTALGVRGGSRFDTRGSTVIANLAVGPLAAARVRDLDHSFAKLRWQIDHQGVFDAAQKKLALETLALRLGRTRVALSGLVANLGPHPFLDLRTRGAGIDLGQILGFLAQADARTLNGIRGGGTLDLDLTLRGELGGRSAAGASRLPDVAGTLRLANAWLQYPEAPAKIEAMSFTAHLAPDSIGIGNLVARVAGQPLRGGVTLTRFADPRVAFAVAGNLDLAAVAPLLVPQGGALSGRAAIDLSGRGRMRDPAAMAIDGRARLSGVRLKQPGLPKEIERLEGTIEFSQMRARVSGLSAQAGSSSFALDATVDRPMALMAKPGSVPMPEPAGVDFAFRAPRLDLADLMPAAGGAPVLPHARGGGTVAIGRLRNGKLEMERVTARVGLDPGVLAVPSFGGSVYQGLASGSARFDLREPARPRLEVKAKLDSARIERLLGAWVPPGNWLNGALSTSLDFAGDLSDLQRSLTAAGLAAVWNGSFGHAPVFDRLAAFTNVPAFKSPSFKNLESRFTIDHGRVFTGPGTLHGAAGDWQFSGSIGLDGTLDYAVSVTLPPAAAQQLNARSALAAGALSDEQGRILMDFRVTGPAQAPRFAWDPSAMRARLAGRVSEALAEQQKKFEQAARDSVARRAGAAEDSARAAIERYRRAAQDSLTRKAKDVLEGFFGGTKDTARR